MTEPNRLWCRCHHHTAWRTKKGWTMRYRCTNGAWGGGGGYPADTAFDRAVRWCATCSKCQAKREASAVSTDDPTPTNKE